MRKLLVGVALLVAGFGAAQLFKNSEVVQAQVAQLGNRDPFEAPDRPKRQAGIPMPEVVNEPFGPDAIAEQPAEVFFGPAEVAVKAFNQTEFDARIQAAEQELNQHLSGLAEQNVAVPAREAKLLKDMQSYLTEGQLDRVISELEAIIQKSPGTEGAKKAAIAIEALKALPQDEQFAPPLKSRKLRNLESDDQGGNNS